MTPRLAGYGRVVGLVASAWMSRSSDILTALYRAQATVEKIRGFMAPRAENDQ